MSKVFTRTFRVRFAEVGASGWVEPAHYLRYLVETAYDWGDAGGFGAAGSEKLGLAWVIRETEFDFFHPLRHNDVFDFTIWMLDWKRVRGFRAYELRLKESRSLVAQGVQQIVSLDSATLRPTVPPESVMAHYRLEQPQQVQSQPFPRLPTAPEGAFTTQRVVERRDLDNLGHVNNAVYISYAAEAAAQALAANGIPPSRLDCEGLGVFWRRAHIQYHNPAVWGERLTLTTYPSALHAQGGRRVVSMRRTVDGSPIADCLFDWSLLDRGSGEAQPLPEALRRAFLSPTARND
jgi:acyl-CoA thioester hydrolase